MAQTIELLSKYVKTNASNLALVDNASAAVNTVLRSLKFNPGDKILRLNLEYPMTKNT